MLWVVSTLLVYSLAMFGGVLPQTFLSVFLVWTAATAVVLIKTALQGKWNAEVMVLSGSLVLALLSPAAIALWMYAMAWAWLTCRSNETRAFSYFKILIVIGILQALLGFFQYFVAPGWIFGYENISRASGTLINRNHFAGLLGMLVPIAISMAIFVSRNYQAVSRSYLLLFAAAFMSLGIFLSVSRMGMFSSIATFLFMGFLTRLRKSPMWMPSILSLIFFSLVVSGAVWIGIDAAATRYSELFADDVNVTEGRIEVYRDTMLMIAKNPLGVGAGQFRDRFREYQTSRTNLLWEHAHSDYLETAAEWGLPAAFVFWSGLYSLLWFLSKAYVCEPKAAVAASMLACAGAMFSLLVHSFADFNLQIPSNAVLFFSLVGISLAHFPRRKPGAAWRAW